jgi:hypothetical protein
VDDDTLRVPGILVDYVLTLSVVAGQSDNIDTLETAWVIPEEHRVYSPTDELQETAYLRTLVADTEYKDGLVAGRGASMYWRDGTYKPPNHVDIDIAMRKTCLYRKFLTTLKHRYYAVGPYFAEQGDAIFMFKGGEMLYLARPTVEGTYHFVGEVYVHGMMDGAIVDDFARGEGTLQMIEFAPVRNTVSDSTKQKGTIIDSAPLTHTFTNVAFNVRRKQAKNPNEDLEVYVHSDVGPRIYDALEEIIMSIMHIFVLQGLSNIQALERTMMDDKWTDIAEQTLLANHPVPEQGGSSKVGIAGRDFARRSYIRATIAHSKIRIATMLMGQLSNMLPNREILAPWPQFEKNTDIGGNVKDEVTEVTGQSKKEVEQQLTEDEFFARRLQEEEYASMNTAIGSNPKPKAKRQQGQPPPGLQRYLYPPSLTANYPLLFPRLGIPVRLCRATTHNPETIQYKFQRKNDHKEWLADMTEYSSTHGGLSAPILFGKWATDPAKRPQVLITGFGREVDLWWEDENGNAVPEPEEKLELRDVGNDGSTILVTLRGDEGGGYMFEIKSEGEENSKMERTKQEMEMAIWSGEWEGDDEAHVPAEFVLP